MLNITAKYLFNLIFIFREICAVFSNECIEPLNENICEKGWLPTIEPQTCIQVRHKRLTWSEADYDCFQDGAELVTPYTPLFTHSIIGSIQFQENFWTAKRLRDIQVIHKKSKDFTFIPGLRAGIVAGPSKCQSLDHRGIPFWGQCDRRLSHICQKPSSLGPPVKPQVGIVFDTREGVAFANRALKVTCSTVGPRYQSLMLTTSMRPLVWSDRSSFPWDLIVGKDVFISATREPFIGVNGTCQYRTTFTYDILVNEGLNYTRFICLSYSDIRKDTCDKITREKFCASSEPIIVYEDGPYRPTIKLNNVASDMVVSTDSVVKATCQGQVGIDKEHTWVLIVGGKAQILQSTDPRIVVYDVIFGDEDPLASLNSAYNVKMTLVLSMNRYMQSFRLACYTTNSLRYSRDDSLCVWPYHLCATTPYIKVQYTYLDLLRFFIASVVGLMFLIIGVAILRVQTVVSAFSEDYSDEKKYSVTVSGEKSTSL